MVIALEIQAEKYMILNGVFDSSGHFYSSKPIKILPFGCISLGETGRYIRVTHLHTFTSFGGVFMGT